MKKVHNRRSFQSGVTLLEVLVVFGLVILLIIGTIYLIRPQEQIAKANDAKRKHDLNELRKIFEDWYSNNGCYPKKTDVCFNDLTPTTCEICTTKPGSPSLSSYTTSDICDPETAIRNYLYQADGDTDCPSAFLVYTKLTSTYNQEADIYNCSPLHACGPPPTYGYDYLVLSSNAVITVAGNFYCYSSGGNCVGCGTYSACDWEVQRGTCDGIYNSKTSCCVAHPGAGFCS